MTPSKGAITHTSWLDAVTLENVANGWLRNLETQLDNLALDFTVTPTRVFSSDTENQLLYLSAGRWLSTLVFAGIGPFSTNQCAMPAQHGLRLENADDTPELICGLKRNSLELGGQNAKGQFLNPTRPDGVIEFALQDGELLSKDQDFEVFFQVSRSFDVDEGKESGENVLEDVPAHLKLCSNV